mgnify:CR=1 FL=1|tara:strand:+ start:4491 stop:4673 length:183 start_codon:yes stop_codon:yes gene_type:complete
MKIDKYIQEHHSGNISAFARTQGVRQDQAARWLKRNCMVVDGIVYCEVSKANKEKLNEQS